MERQEQENRQEALDLAVRYTESPADADEVLKVAKKYFEFLEGDKKE